MSFYVYLQSLGEIVLRHYLFRQPFGLPLSPKRTVSAGAVNDNLQKYPASGGLGLWHIFS